MKLSEEDIVLVNFAKLQVSNLQVEINTIQGFIGHFISNKYKINNQQLLDTLLNGEEINLHGEVSQGVVKED